LRPEVAEQMLLEANLSTRGLKERGIWAHAISNPAPAPATDWGAR
jgi:hypothetical protein